MMDAMTTEREYLEPRAKRSCTQLYHVSGDGAAMPNFCREKANGDSSIIAMEVEGNQSQTYLPGLHSKGMNGHVIGQQRNYSNGRRARCGLFMPTYGGFENLKGEIRAVTIEKCPLRSLGIATCAIGNQCAEDQRVIISDIKPGGVAASNRSLQRGMQILSVNHTSVKGMGQYAVDQLIHEAYCKAEGRHVELVLHLL